MTCGCHGEENAFPSCDNTRLMNGGSLVSKFWTRCRELFLLAEYGEDQKAKELEQIP